MTVLVIHVPRVDVCRPIGGDTERESECARVKSY